MQILEKEIAADQFITTTRDRKFLWVGTEIAEERSGDDGGTVQKRFFAQGFVDSDGTILLYTRDHLGSIRELVDINQVVRARYDYDPYGNVTKVSGDRDSDFLYTGHYWHQQSGLFLTLYRAYDPVVGRWISRDPLEEKGGINLYGYVGNSPIVLIDPLGLTPPPFMFPQPIVDLPTTGVVINFLDSDYHNPAGPGAISIIVHGMPGLPLMKDSNGAPRLDWLELMVNAIKEHKGWENARIYWLNVDRLSLGERGVI